MITALILTRHGGAHCNAAGLAGGERTCTGRTEQERNRYGQELWVLAALNGTSRMASPA